MPDNRDDVFPGWPRVGGGSGDAPAAGGTGSGGDDSSDPANPDDGGDGSGEPATVDDVEAAAAEFDAKALAEAGAAPPAGKGDGEDGKDKGQPPASDPLDEFIKENYGGNKAAFVASLHESRKEAKRLSDEVAVLKAERAPKPAPRDTAAEVKAARDASPDVQAIDRKVKAIDTAVAEIGARQVQIGVRAGAIEKELAALAASLPHLEGKEWSTAATRHADLRVELAGIQGEFMANETRKESLGFRRESLQERLERTEREIADELASKDERERAEAASNERVRSTFKRSFDALIEPFGLDPEKSPADKERLTYIHNSIRAQLADYLESLGEEEGLDAQGIYEATAKLIASYARVHGMKPRAAAPTPPRPGLRPAPRNVQIPAARASAPAGRAGDGGPAPRTLRSAEEVLDDPDLVRRRADAVFSAAQRGRGQARSLRGQG